MSDYEYDTEEYGELAARLDRLERAAEESDYGAEEESLPYQIAGESLQDGITARQYLERVAEQTREAVFNEAGRYPQAPATDDELLVAAKQIASPAVDWDADGPQMVEYMAENHIDLAPVLATRDPQELGKALMSVKTQMSLAELNRQIKNQAQTMSGTNSSHESPSEWDRIASAKGMPSFRYQQ